MHYCCAKINTLKMNNAHISQYSLMSNYGVKNNE